MNEERDYRAAPGVNYSNLKHMRKSAAHYRQNLLAPPKDNPAWARGRLIHCLTLEPFSFDDDFFVYEGRRDKRTKAYQAALEEAAGRDVVTPAEHELALEVAKAATAHPTLAAMLAQDDAQVERPLFWEEAPVGTCKGKPDVYVVTEDKHVLLDLKTFPTTDEHTVSRAAALGGWHLQVAHYLAGLEATYGKPQSVEAHLLVAEVEAPFDVRCFTWGEDSIEAAKVERLDLLDRLADALKTDTWPGRPAFATLDLPAWYLSQHLPSEY